jgi:hypothetical protein
MKTIILFCFAFISGLLAQQNYYTFSELKGMEDNSGNTHLFYRLYAFQKGGGPIGDHYENSIYHFNLQNQTDSLFLFDGGSIGESSTSINDLEFWNNNPDEFIYCGVWVTVDPTAFIKLYDKDEAVYDYFGGDNCSIELSKQNDSLIYASVQTLIKSTNRGETWLDVNDEIRLLSVSPLNDEVVFGLTSSGELTKSTNGGENYTIVDTTKTSPYYEDLKNGISYDKDENHIYHIYRNNNGSHLSISNNKGVPFSWSVRYSSSNNIFISADNSQSGKLFLADGRRIYVSEDYGLSFNEYKVLDRKIVGIYKNPNSDRLYAATKYDLYEITFDSIITLKHLISNPDIFSWYPLQIGNKWVYEQTVEIYTNRFAIEVVDDTLIAGYYYYKIKRYNLDEEEYYFERIDSSEGKVYRYISESDDAKYDFSLTDVGDTLIFDENDEYEIGWFLEHEEPFNQWGLTSTKRMFNAILITSGYQLYTFVKDIGLYREEGGEVLYSVVLLKGMVKDGVAYGDISLVGVDDNQESPKEFSLYQNYPNPFNPTTNIGFRIANSGFISLKVYDILGREVATLVNEDRPAGEYEVKFDASGLTSGLYIYKLQTENYSSTKKMIYLK